MLLAASGRKCLREKLREAATRATHAGALIEFSRDLASDGDKAAKLIGDASQLLLEVRTALTQNQSQQGV